MENFMSAAVTRSKKIRQNSVYIVSTAFPTYRAQTIKTALATECCLGVSSCAVAVEKVYYTLGKKLR